MFPLGFTALLQSMVIPGTLILKAMDFKGSFIQKLAYMVALSLTATYVIVLTLTLLGIYHQWSVLVFIVIECLAFVWLYRSELKTLISRFFVQTWKNFIQTMQRLISSLENVKSFSDFINALVLTGMFILSMVALWWAFKLITYYAGTIFDAWRCVPGTSPCQTMNG